MRPEAEQLVQVLRGLTGIIERVNRAANAAMTSTHERASITALRAAAELHAELNKPEDKQQALGAKLDAFEGAFLALDALSAATTHKLSDEEVNTILDAIDTLRSKLPKEK